MYHYAVTVSFALLMPSVAQHMRGAASRSKTNSSGDTRMLQSSELVFSKSQGACRAADGSLVRDGHIRVGDGYTIEDCAAACGPDCTAFEVNERRVCHTYAAEGLVGSGDACCTCHTKSTSTPVQTELWPQIGDNHSKCTPLREHRVKDRVSCQLEAVARGHKYYQFADPPGVAPHCSTADSCAAPINGTVWPWKIYTQATLKLDNVICPFFATMLNTDILATKAAYSRGELLTFMMDAGVAENIAIGHVEANFAHIHSDMMNLFDMEGNPNEHQTSTGILDCPSSYQAEIGGSGNCTFDALVRNRKCSPVSAVSCINGDRVREAGAFELFWNAADKFPKDGILNRKELRAAGLLYNTRENNEFGRLSDINDGSHLDQPGPIRGTISGSFADLVRVFGETCSTITKETLKLVVLDRQRPSHYSFPSARVCD